MANKRHKPEEIVQSLVNFWADKYTYKAIETLNSSERPPVQKLLLLMKTIHRNGLNLFDAAFRSWAAQEPSVAEVVRQVDVARHRTVSELFSGIGFEGDELRERTRVWLVFHSAQSTVHIPEDATVTNATIAQRFRFFTGFDADLIDTSAEESIVA